MQLTRTLKKGLTGEDIRQAKEMLYALGYLTVRPTHNSFGSDTERAVKAFQAANKDTAGKQLTVDGLIGQKTWGALEKQYAALGDDQAASVGQKIADLIISREGKNQYTQGANRTKVDSGYSDCSSLTQWAAREAASVNIGSNTTSQINSAKLETVELSIVNGVPDESKMLPGDFLYFRGTDTGRGYAQYVGHVEAYVGNGQLSGHGSGVGPTRKNMANYCKQRQNTKSDVPGGNRGLICVRRIKG